MGLSVREEEVVVLLIGKEISLACPRSRVKIGNFYQNQMLDPLLPCRRKVCDCYIAFSNLTNHPLRRIMGAGCVLADPG